MDLFSANGTYVLTSDLSISENAEIAENVTLIFQGGKIVREQNGVNSSETLTITGKHTKIIAPITQIFGAGIVVSGTWDIDRAYPQWFGTKAFDTIQDYSNPPTDVEDASEGINNAINMKLRGEVFLPKGFYIIKEPIIVKDGIQLIGEKGMEQYPDNNYEGTILQSWRNMDNNAILDSTNQFMIHVNANSERSRITEHNFLAGQITTIRDIQLYNYIPSHLQFIYLRDGQLADNEYNIGQLTKKTTACVRGIFACENLLLDHVRFYNFRNALSYENRYIDSKKVSYCDYVCNNPVFSLLDKLFAFDFGIFGDDLMFDHNSIQNGKYNKGLCLQNCNSGIIRCNIMHADIEIKNSKAISLSNNHMEFGPVVIIKESNVSMSNNYIERAYRTPIELSGNQYRDKSIVSMHNDVIVFVENLRPYYEREEADEDGGNPDFTAFKDRLSNASEYDIKIDNNAVLSLEHVYRHRICIISGKVYPMGIKICKNDETPLDTFNDFSYMLSQKGSISCDFNVDKFFALNDINNISIYTAMINSQDVYWLENSGKYMYKYQIIYDKNRPLLATRNNSQIFDVNNDSSLSNGVVKNILNGILLCVADNNGNGARATIRLFRKRGTDWGQGTDLKYVDIPNNNNHLFYDNGISINGYRWKAATSSDILNGATGIESITFQGDNVVCRINGSGDNSTWSHGDVLIKLGADPSIEVK